MSVNTPMSALRENIIRCLKTRTIAAIKGPAGVGKSEMVRSIARQLGVQLFTVIGSIADPTDISGFPTISNARLKCAFSGREHPVLEFAPRDIMVRANTYPGAIFFFDEMSSTPAAVRAGILHLITQWQAGDYNLNPDIVGFVTAYNDASEAVNGSDLGFPLSNRLTHFDWPMTADAVHEWAAEFPGYWGNPKVVSWQGAAVPEEYLARARASIAGYIRREPNAWHYLLWEQSAAAADGDKTQKKKAGKTYTAGEYPEGGALTPRSWDRVSRHLALTLVEKEHPLTCMPLIVAEIGEGAAASFQVYLNNVNLPDPETLLTDPGKFAPAGRIDVDFATVISVTAAVKANLTPERYDAAWQILERCADKNRGNQVAYEAGAVGALQLQPYLTEHGSADLTRDMKPGDKRAYLAKLMGRTTPYLQIAKAISGRPKA